jgi:hypothetical protein
MIALDFYSGSHGHFLEYLINTYIFKGPRVPEIFTELGTSHNIRKDPDYMQSRTIFAAHYTEFDINLPITPGQVVRISVETEIEKICYQLNVFCRAGDIPAENKLLCIPEEERLTIAQLRNNFYSKLKTEGHRQPDIWRWNESNIFVFSMSALYDIYQLYQTLHELARFLGHSFNPDASLTDLWKQFMLKNHGWNYWINANKTLEKILNNSNDSFNSDIWAQALLNYLISNAVGVFDGPLHENNQYPSNTADIYQLIQSHIQQFDQRF